MSISVENLVDFFFKKNLQLAFFFLVAYVSNKYWSIPIWENIFC